ncbi:MAG: c-type cytochrome domain-containing protein, partial [Limisphaerales bacterium]
MSALVSTSLGAWCIETSPIRRNRFHLGSMLLAFVLLASFGCLGGTEAMDFRRDIQPILSNHCFPCHGPDAAERKANLRLDRLDDLDGLPEGILIPEHPESSAIIHRVLSQDPAERMPPPDTHLE